MMPSDDKTQFCVEIAEICERIARGFDVLQKHHADQAVKYGYCRDRFQQLRDFHRQFPNCSPPDETLASLEKLEQFVNLKQSQIEAEHLDISSGALVVSTSTAVSDITVFSLGSTPPSSIESPKIPPWWNPEQIEEYASAFDDISPRLGDHLRAAWEGYHGTTHDPARSVLYHLRELSDQFFRSIASNDEVQQSKFFKEKKPPETNQVYREERINYSASKIKDRTTADYVSSLTSDMLKLHKKLNYLHKAGRIEVAHVRDTIIATAGLLFLWVTAIKNNK